jgi:hypothetical protein
MEGLTVEGYRQAVSVPAGTEANERPEGLSAMADYIHDDAKRSEGQTMLAISMDGRLELYIQLAGQRSRDQVRHTLCRLNRFAGRQLLGQYREQQCGRQTQFPRHTKPPKCA